MKKFILLGALVIAAMSCGQKEGGKEEPDPEIKVVSVTVLPQSVTLKPGETSQLSATVIPENATDKTVVWVSSAPGVATVTAEGLVKAIADGEASITASCGGKQSACAVKVVKPVVAASSVTLDKTGMSLVEGETATLHATVLPEDTTDKTVTWTSSNTAVATVDGGTVTAVLEGTATITASCGAAFATCEITVARPEFPVTSVTLDYDSLTLLKGEVKLLTATVLPENATNPAVTWTSSDAAVVKVSEGKLEALSAGKATIYAKAGNITATCEVTVTQVNAGENEGTGSENWN